MLKRSYAIMGVILTIVFTSALTGCGFTKDKNTYDVPTLVQASAASNQKTVKVQRGDVARTDTIIGKVIAATKTDLSFGSAEGYLAKLDVKVGDTVKQGDVIAELNKDEIQYEIKQQEISVQLAQLDCDQINKTPNASDYDKQKASLQLESEKLKLDQLNDHLSKSVLVASTSGIVISMPDIKINEKLEPFEAVATIADKGSYQVEGDVRNATLTPGTKVKISVKATISMPDVDGEVVNNEIDNTGAVKDNSKIIFKFDSDTKGLNLGDEATVKYTQQKASNVLFLPDSAVKKGSGNHPYVEIIKNGEVSDKYIETGVDDGTNIEIVSGVSEEDTVISE